MHNLHELLQADGRLMHNSVLPEEAFRSTLSGAIETFKEASLLDAFPVDYLDFGPGALESRIIKLIDQATAQHGMKGTGGQVDRVSYAMDDQPFYPIWANVEVPMRELAASQFGPVGLDLLRDSGRNAALLIQEKVNELLVKGLGPLKGVSTATGIQTFGSAGAWSTADIAYKDITKAVIDKFGTKKVPQGMSALICHPTRLADLMQNHSSTAVLQLERIKQLLPGGIRTSVDCPADKAYVYAKTPSVIRVRVAQNLTVIPLPKVDEDERLRVRIIPTIHFPRPDGIVEITSIDA